MINFGMLIGVMLSNLQFIDLSSTRNLAIIGMSILLAMMLPYWVSITPNAIDVGKIFIFFFFFKITPIVTTTAKIIRFSEIILISQIATEEYKI